MPLSRGPSLCPRAEGLRAGSRGGTLARSLAALAAGALGAACGAVEAPSSALLEELERLAFVPPGSCVIGLGERLRVDCSTDVALLVDRFEATREDWLDFLATGPEGVDFPAWVVESWSDRKLLDRPAASMTFDEAQRFASWRGMRLPTPREWVRIAAGTREQRFPWGSDAESIANTLELGLGRTTDVGTFEEGASPEGVYDLIGNVWEWVDGRLPRRPEGDGRTWAMGGSYAYRRRPIHGPRAGSFISGLVPPAHEPTAEASFNTLLLDPGHRSQDIGLRCVVEAEAYLLRRAHLLGRARFGRTQETRRRVHEVGRRFGPAAIPFLTELSRRPDTPPAIEWMLEGARR